MEHFRTDIQRHKTEPKNYIALNRKKACAKTTPNLPPIPEAARHTIQEQRMLPRREREREGPLTGDVKRSIEQLASIISSGDLERIIQLSKEIKGTAEGEEQPDHLRSQVSSQDKDETRPRQVQSYKVVKPSCVLGLDMDRGNIPKSIPKSVSPITTAIPIQANSTEPFFGRGLGLRQLLELDNTRPVPSHSHSVKQSQSTHTNETARRAARVEETEYYPWGKPGCGAPLSQGYDMQQKTIHAIHHKPIQVNSQEKSSNDSTLVRNSDTLRPEEERKRRAYQYKLDLQAQVIEKGRLKREEQERQAEFDRKISDRIARDQDRQLLEAERERERFKQKQQDAHKRFEILQAKLEEQNRLAIAEKERKKKHHHTNISRKKQNNSPSNLQPMNPTVIPYHKQKSLKPKKQTQQQTNNQQGQIRNPPPSQIHITKPNNLNKNIKSYSLPTTRQIESETVKNYLNVSSEFLDHSMDLSRPSSTATSIDRVISLHDTTTRPDSSALLQQQVYREQESISVMRQLQKLKQGLHVKQQELHSNYI